LRTRPLARSKPRQKKPLTTCAEPPELRAR
jgi:hypothetical protein